MCNTSDTLLDYADSSLLDYYANIFLQTMLDDDDTDAKVDFAQLSQLGKQAYKSAGDVMKSRAQVLAKLKTI